MRGVFLSYRRLPGDAANIAANNAEKKLQKILDPAFRGVQSYERSNLLLSEAEWA
jgi:hypothetical protein